MSRIDRAASFYNRWAVVYDLLARRTPGVAPLRRRAIQQLHPPTGSVVIDMGCGPGPNAGHLRRHVGPEGTVIGIDLADAALGRARREIATEGWSNVHVVRGDATDPPVMTADAVFEAFVLGMFPDPASTVQKWCDLVGPGGRVGLLDFAPSTRWYAPLPNLALRGLVVASTPGRARFRANTMGLLSRRVRAGHAALAARCRDRSVSTHWGGIVRLQVGTVA